jgi:hypothetical protein
MLDVRHGLCAPSSVPDMWVSTSTTDAWLRAFIAALDLAATV